ncbi:conserved hypothetical protein [Bathymodiolus platifrons methanotrophic gill symbiont]|uniref:DUF4390 domain-containing protein n=1 Tax=Bathymodiolus platifrons methanotrophic gill symbiont TaxID=113268 RepID=UPI000B417BED|nr:DUF4390 domain-containing protein [Bathymodiolus platifrons methanotrophic gill symbiont]GAW87059.1 conserved hypothetical protein [Bathymodiolus platifrons methanotrophic gill symbiont]GFO76370.1 hypothetical protein BPLS_P4098 [Bathymodiolus platifrons methanotrophic gill symbiont]
MGFIMRVCRKNKALLLYFLTAILYGIWGVEVCHAKGKFVKIKQAQLSLTDNKARLSVNLDFQLSPGAKAALHSGIALYWDVSIMLKQDQWRGLWCKTLATRHYRYSLTYYTLLNNFRVKNEQNKTFRRFSSLHEALLYMQHFESEQMVISGYNKNQCVMSVLSVSFDKEMLPAPLRPVAYFDKQWDLSTKERQWCE